MNIANYYRFLCIILILKKTNPVSPNDGFAAVSIEQIHYQGFKNFWETQFYFLIIFLFIFS